MSEHLHSAVVLGCYRCEIGQDEYRAVLLEQISDAADRYREAEQELLDAVTSARVVGLSEIEIEDARTEVPR